MKHVNLKISATGTLCAANPLAKAGYPIYRIEQVPDSLPISSVILKLNRIILAHPTEGAENWVYQWPEIERLPDGAVINRYRKQA